MKKPKHDCKNGHRMSGPVEQRFHNRTLRARSARAVADIKVVAATMTDEAKAAAGRARINRISADARRGAPLTRRRVRVCLNGCGAGKVV